MDIKEFLIWCGAFISMGTLITFGGLLGWSIALYVKEMFND